MTPTTTSPKPVAAIRDQRKAALALANRRRLAMAKVRKELRQRERRFRDLDFSDEDVQRMTVLDIVNALPWHNRPGGLRSPAQPNRLGPINLLVEGRFSPSTRVASLRPHRLVELIALVEKRCPSQRPEAQS